MKRPPWILALCALVASPGAAAGQVSIPRDDIKDRSVHWNAHLITPLLLSEDETELYAINQGGQRLAILHPLSMQLLAEVPTGPGLVAMAQRPGTEELWLVDKVTSSVAVLDLATRTIEKSLRVGAEPHGIAFTPPGDRAYVACSGVDRVDVVAGTAFAVETSIPIPAKNPRAVVHHLGTAWVVPHVSGNNTAPMGAAASGPDVDNVVDVTSLALFPGLNQLPDRDLLGIPTQASPALDALDPGLTRTGLGTLLFNAHVRPGTSELWIPNTDAQNAEHKGEKSFLGGQCVGNRVTIVDLSGALPPEVVDLDALAPPGLECSQPTGLAFDPVRPRVYVCCYGSDRIAVLDVAGTPAWLGAIELPFLGGYPEGTGPRTCAVDAAGNRLYVLNKGNSSVTRIDLAQVPSGAGFAWTAPDPVSLGFDSVAGAERFGRNDLVDGGNSKSKTTSCASCHMDGHQDGTVWNLGVFLDPEGTPKGALAFPLDDKGPLATQSVRRMFESGPYHWRGERDDLRDFNQAFIDLLEREVNGVPATLGAHFKYLENYMLRVSYVPNPRQELDRSLTAEQQAGAALFATKDVSDGATCATCHALPIGTSGEIVASHVRGKFQMADVPQLRGLVDKLAPSYFIGGAFGTRTELGAGLSHGGAFPTITDLLLAPHPVLPGQPAFDLTPAEASSIAAFLSAFDTGLAPAAGYQATANADNAAGFAAAELDYLTGQADAGHCDLIARRAPELFAGVEVWPSALYDPATGTFVVAQAGAPALSQAALLAEAAAGSPVTFIGVPLWMGYPLAIDRDLDHLLDLDELLEGTAPDRPDTDNDGFPDGYEVALGLDPLVKETSAPDTQAPALQAPPVLGFTTTTTIKFEIETDEVCQVLVTYNGGKVVQRLPLDTGFDDRFSIIVGELDAGTDYDFDLALIDPAGNQGQAIFTFSTTPLAFPPPVYVDGIELALERSPKTGVPRLVAGVELLAGGVPPATGYRVEVDVFHAAANGAPSVIQSGITKLLTAPDGTLTFKVPLGYPSLGPVQQGSPGATPGPGTLYFVVRSITAPPGEPPYARQLNKQTWATIPWN